MEDATSDSYIYSYIVVKIVGIYLLYVAAMQE